MAQQVQKFRALQGSFNLGAGADKKFVDVSIPSGIGKVDLSKTDFVVKFDVSSESTTAALAAFANPPVLDTLIRVKRTGDDNRAPSSPAAIIRHAELRSQRLGVIESIRNVDLLRQTLSLYKVNELDRERQFKKGHNASHKQFFNSNGVLDSVGKGNENSVDRTHDFAVPLKAIFEYCNNPAYDTDKDGELFVHCEMNFPSVDAVAKKVSNEIFTVDAGAGTRAQASLGDFARARGGTEVLGVASVDNAHFKNIDISSLISSDAATAGVVGAGDAETGLVYRTVAQYPDMRDCPFHVGQAMFLKIQTNANADGTGAPQALLQLEGVIRRIEKANAPSVGTGLTTPAQASDAVDLTFQFVGGVNGITVPNTRKMMSVTVELATGAQDVVANVGENTSIAVNDVELQVVVDPENSAPSPYQYVTYLAEEDNYTAANQFNRNYDIPAGTRNVYIMFSPQNGASLEPNLGSYRLTIDNNDVFGRVVNYDSSLHRELINQAFTNSGDRVKNLDGAYYGYSSSRLGEHARALANGHSGIDGKGTGQATAAQLIALPVPVSNQVQKLGVELNGFAAADGAGADLAGRHVIYYERVVSK